MAFRVLPRQQECWLGMTVCTISHCIGHTEPKLRVRVKFNFGAVIGNYMGALLVMLGSIQSWAEKACLEGSSIRILPRFSEEPKTHLPGAPASENGGHCHPTRVWEACRMA